MNATIRLLYAEDNPHDADLMRERFAQEACDLTLEIVGSGKLCLERLSNGKFDLLLLDNKLPDMDGLDVLAILRGKGDEVPVVMITGTGNSDTVGLALRAGAFDYISKTGDYLATLPDILRLALNRQRRSLLAFGNSHSMGCKHILYVEPSSADAELAQNYFALWEPLFQLHHIGSCAEAFQLLLSQEHQFDLVLTELRTPRMDAQNFIHEALHRGIRLPFIIITHSGDEASALNSLHLGAYDYILKREGYLEQLRHSIRHALQRFYLDQANFRLSAELYALNASLESQVEQRTAELKHEIEARKQTEISLRENENILRSLFEKSHDPIILSKHDRIIDCNMAAVELLLAFGKNSLIGRDLNEIYPYKQTDGKISSRNIEKMRVLAMRDGSHRFDWQLKRLDGKIIPVEVSLTAIKIDGDWIIHGLLRDMTVQQIANDQILRLSQAYRLLSLVNEEIVRTQNRQQLFTNICQHAVESGLFRLAWVGLLKDNILIPETFAGFNEGYVEQLNIHLGNVQINEGPIAARALREGKHSICQDIRIDPNMGPWREKALRRGYFSSACFPISENGKTFGVFNVYSAEANYFTLDIVQLLLELAADISFALDVMAERKNREQAEAELSQLNAALESRVQERTRELKSLNKELEAFSYSVSHDLRAPLRAISGFTQVLLKDCAVNLNETGLNYLHRVHAASKDMETLIEELLMLSKVALSSVSRMNIDLSEMAVEIMTELQELDVGHKVHFICQPSLQAYADRGLLHVLLTNLLSNAIKFTKKNAIAEIEFASALSEDGKIYYFVRDNGIGFDMKYADKLFIAFQRLHNHDDFEGTGVGLATVKRIVQRHHGRIWAFGKNHEGATFCFSLSQ